MAQKRAPKRKAPAKDISTASKKRTKMTTTSASTSPRRSRRLLNKDPEYKDVKQTTISRVPSNHAVPSNKEITIQEPQEAHQPEELVNVEEIRQRKESHQSEVHNVYDAASPAWDAEEKLLDIARDSVTPRPGDGELEAPLHLMGTGMAMDEAEEHEPKNKEDLHNIDEHGQPDADTDELIPWRTEASYNPNLIFETETAHQFGLHESEKRQLELAAFSAAIARTSVHASTEKPIEKEITEKITLAEKTLPGIDHDNMFGENFGEVNASKPVECQPTLREEVQPAGVEHEKPEDEIFDPAESSSPTYGSLATTEPSRQTHILPPSEPIGPLYEPIDIASSEHWPELNIKSLGIRPIDVLSHSDLKAQLQWVMDEICKKTNKTANEYDARFSPLPMLFDRACRIVNEVERVGEACGYKPAESSITHEPHTAERSDATQSSLDKDEIRDEKNEASGDITTGELLITTASSPKTHAQGTGPFYEPMKYLYYPIRDIDMESYSFRPIDIASQPRPNWGKWIEDEILKRSDILKVEYLEKYGRNALQSQIREIIKAAEGAQFSEFMGKFAKYGYSENEAASSPSSSGSSANTRGSAISPSGYVLKETLDERDLWTEQKNFRDIDPLTKREKRFEMLSSQEDVARTDAGPHSTSSEPVLETPEVKADLRGLAADEDDSIKDEFDAWLNGVQKDEKKKDPDLGYKEKVEWKVQDEAAAEEKERAHEAPRHGTPIETEDEIDYDEDDEGL